MSKNEDYFELSRTATIRGWAFGLMARGAGWGALLFIGVICFVLIIRAFAWVLPEESQQAPSPYGAVIEAPLPGVAVTLKA